MENDSSLARGPARAEASETAAARCAELHYPISLERARELLDAFGALDDNNWLNIMGPEREPMPAVARKIGQETVLFKVCEAYYARIRNYVNLSVLVTEADFGVDMLLVSSGGDSAEGVFSAQRAYLKKFKDFFDKAVYPERRTTSPEIEDGFAGRLRGIFTKK